jgi:hypothetical protein
LSGGDRDIARTRNSRYGRALAHDHGGGGCVAVHVLPFVGGMI